MSEPSPLDVYLNDHLAGGTGAIDLVSHAADEHAGKPLGEFFSRLRTEIEQDHQTLQDIMTKVGSAPNPLKQMGAKVMEKISRFKLSGSGSAELSTLLTLETLQLGVEGKACLWRALKAAAGDNEVLRSFDLDGLLRRAEDQVARLEEQRVDVAGAALSMPAGV